MYRFPICNRAELQEKNPAELLEQVEINQPARARIGIFSGHFNDAGLS